MYIQEPQLDFVASTESSVAQDEEAISVMDFYDASSETPWRLRLNLHRVLRSCWTSSSVPVENIDHGTLRLLRSEYCSSARSTGWSSHPAMWTRGKCIRVLEV